MENRLFYLHLTLLQYTVSVVEWLQFTSQYTYRCLAGVSGLPSELQQRRFYSPFAYFIVKDCIWNEVVKAVAFIHGLRFWHALFV